MEGTARYPEKLYIIYIHTLVYIYSLQFKIDSC